MPGRDGAPDVADHARSALVEQSHSLAGSYRPQAWRPFSSAAAATAGTSLGCRILGTRAAAAQLLQLVELHELSLMRYETTASRSTRPRSRIRIWTAGPKMHTSGNSASPVGET